MRLSTVQKQQIDKEKDQFISEVREAFKLPNLTFEEDKLLTEALTFALKDQIGKYDERHKTLITHIYVVRGIVHSHEKKVEKSIFDGDAI